MLYLKNLSKWTMYPSIYRKSEDGKTRLVGVPIPSMERYFFQPNDILTAETLEYYKSLASIKIQLVIEDTEGDEAVAYPDSESSLEIGEICEPLTDKIEEEEEEEEESTIVESEDGTELTSEEIVEEEESHDEVEEIVESDVDSNIDLSEADLGEISAYLESHSKGGLRDLVARLSLDVDTNMTKNNIIRTILETDAVYRVFEELQNQNN